MVMLGVGSLTTKLLAKLKKNSLNSTCICFIIKEYLDIFFKIYVQD